uniref:Uncharacterized protein n=1 Tax=Timema shepardi TaxID=629360 RepID=A0A7R9B163_TIMSH|nr:unnamed protein product [Timema shepardi]
MATLLSGNDLSGVAPQEPGAPRQPPTSLAPWGGPVIEELFGVTDKVHTPDPQPRGYNGCTHWEGLSPLNTGISTFSSK